MKRVLILLGLVVILFASSVYAQQKLVIADFDSGVKPNNIGGDFGAWEKDPADFTGMCVESFNVTERMGDSGFCMAIDYDVDSPNPMYNGFWMKLNGADFSKYKNWVMKVKGDKVKGYTKVLKIELKNNLGEVGKYYITEIGDDWKELKIPFIKFAGITDFSNMTEFVIVFEDWRATKKEGRIYIDDLMVSE
ncbi:MAG: carbohydrate binding domain-containing protein [Candidatus Omnitrophota bacterium]